MYLKHSNTTPHYRQPQRPRASPSNLTARVVNAVAAALAGTGAVSQQQPQPKRYPRLPEAWKRLVVQYLDPQFQRTAFPMRYCGIYFLKSGRPTTEYRVIGREHLVAHVGISDEGAPTVAHCNGGVANADFRISF